MKYVYEAYSTEEGLVTGRLNARNEAGARADLVMLGLRPLIVKPVFRIPSMEQLFPSLFKVPTGEMVRFFRHLATMLASGSNLLRTLELFQAESKNKALRAILESIHEHLVEGGNFSEALAQHPKVFSTLMVSIAEVGEYTGKLAPALEQLAEVLEKEQEVKSKAIKTLMYPMAIVGLSMATLAVLVLIALPPLMKSFERLGAETPMITRIVMSSVTMVRGNMMNILMGVVAILGLYAVSSHIPRARYWRDRIMLTAPLVGPIVVASGLARFSRTVSMLLQAGVSPAAALELGTRGCKNQVLQEVFADADESLMSGHGLSTALKRHPILPGMFVQLVMIGEESNSLERTITDAANTYEKELDRRLGGLLGMLEPISTMVVGAIVGLIAFSMFLPIYSGLNAVE